MLTCLLVGTVPESKMPLIAMLVDQITCIGDQQQLTPFSNIDGRETGFTPLSFFHRLSSSLPRGIPMLTTQYRMATQIGNLVSQLFYEGKLITDSNTALNRSMANVRNGPVISWLDHNDLESKAVKGYSTFNEKVRHAAALQLQQFCIADKFALRKSTRCAPS